MRWCRELATALRESVSINADSWETPDGTPVSMAGLSPMAAGTVRLGSVRRIM
ncbi:hypothetical protein ACPMJQ_31925 [Streptomyces pseudogriseolus]|uniref:Uncharacterized protein n=1 Tax=Streptomyces sp. R02 TaxID=3238623 RepID=A0AB39LX64_9ACTN|nr:hypothetical protein [Streptomyces pseudogriseolus]